MELTPETVERLAEDYGETQPLAAVEAEHLETLPAALAAGEFGWRDAEWVVQWFYRRFLGTYPDDVRREREGDYGENDYEDVRDAVVAAAEAEDTASKLDLLINLTGVGVPVASAFLQFLDPDAYVVMSAREWAVLRRAGELSDPYPDDPATADYERYVSTCRAVAEACRCDLWTLYRAVWQQWAENLQGSGGRTAGE